MWLLIGLFIIFLLILDYQRKSYVDRFCNIGGLRFLPLIGNIHQYWNYTPEALLELSKEHYQEYDNIFRAWIFSYYFIGVSDLNIIEPILNNSKHITKNLMYVLLKPWLKEGLLLSTGPKWFQRRRIITPAFHFSILEQFVQVFDEQSNIMIEKLHPVANTNKPIDIHEYVALAALDAVSESALGIKINAQSDPNCEYVKAIGELSNILVDRFLKVHHFHDILFSTIGFRTKRRHDKLLKTLHSFTQQIIQDRRKLLEKEMNITETNPEEDIYFGKRKRMAFLDLLLKTSIEGNPLSDDDIREEVDTFTFEGHDTTTSGICFTLFLISRHREVQRKIFEEIKDIFGNDKTRPATYNDLQQLKYTECVIKEGLRMYPPVPLIGRVMEVDLKVGNKILPAGASVHIPFIVTMRNPKYFPDPDKFIPERHFGETGAELLNPFAFAPFSAGPRNCIGQRFAMLEMKSMITKILRHYELIPMGEDVRPVILIVLRSITGYHMGLKPRVY